MIRAVVRVPATSANLGPGFDCLGLALDLHNTVTLDVVPRPVEPAVVVRGEGRDRLPRTGRNLALRAAQTEGDDFAGRRRSRSVGRADDDTLR